MSFVIYFDYTKKEPLSSILFSIDYWQALVEDVRITVLKNQAPAEVAWSLENAAGTTAQCYLFGVVV